jgi:hypothetical protein
VRVEPGLELRNPLADRVKAQEQFPCELGMVVDGGGGPRHLRVARGQAEADERLRTEARHGLLQQECVRIGGEPPDGDASALVLADQRRARVRGSQPTLEPRAGDVEDVAVAFGELALRAP